MDFFNGKPTIANENRFKKGPKIVARGCTHASVSDIMIEGTSFRIVLTLLSIPLCNISTGDIILRGDEAGSVTVELTL
jgi:hypothetical protein